MGGVLVRCAHALLRPLRAVNSTTFALGSLGGPLCRSVWGVTSPFSLIVVSVLPHFSFFSATHLIAILITGCLRLFTRLGGGSLSAPQNDGPRKLKRVGANRAHSTRSYNRLRASIQLKLWAKREAKVALLDGRHA